MDENVFTRRRIEDVRAEIDNQDRPIDQRAANWVGQILTNPIPSTLPAIVLVEPVRVFGTQTEGSSVGLKPNSTVSTPVVLIGPNVPPSGAKHVVRSIGNRWAIGYSVPVSPSGTTCLLNVKGCNNSALPGATGSLIQGTTTVATGTTDGSGNLTLGPVPNGSYTLQVSFPAFSTYSATVTLPSAEVYVTLTPDGSHVCSSGCVSPIPRSLPAFDPGGSFTLTYNDANGDWEGCHQVTTASSVQCPSVSIPLYYKYTIYGPYNSTALIYAPAGQTQPGGPVCYLGGYSCGGYPWPKQGSYTISTVSSSNPKSYGVCSTCNPYGAIIAAEDDTCLWPDASGGCAPLHTLFYYGFGTDCRGTSPITFTVRGCNMLVLPGASVSVADGSGWSVGGTTDASGQVTLQVKTPGWVTMTFAKARFATKTETANFAITDSTYATNILSDSNHYCISNCADPLPATLKLTDPNSSTANTLTYDAPSKGWIGCYVKSAVSGQALNGTYGCQSALVGCPIAYIFDGGTLKGYYPGCDSVSFVPTNGSCPRGSGFANEGTATATGSLKTCPTAFSWTGNLVLPASVGSLVNGAITITE